MSSFKFRPSLESLDARLTPSVTVVQVANELVITGDKDPDVVRLFDNGQGQVSGFATGVGFFVKNGIEKITVNTEGGDDNVEYSLTDYLHAGQQQKVYVGLGSNFDPNPGNDRFYANLQDKSLAGGSRLDISADGGGGDDSLFVNARNLGVRPTAVLKNTIVGGFGNDTLAQLYSGVDQGTVTMRTHGQEGNDLIRQEMSFFAGSTGATAGWVTGGEGDDQVSLYMYPTTTMTVVLAQVEGNAGTDFVNFNAPIVTGIP
ncbi:MAG TPA: hypothetical protein VMZ71_02975 [Gemmataceae bacterium]|nr:hypothetical protein [Gemmataceae bacterium]